MEYNFGKCLDIVLRHEGGYVNHPDDPGGMTNLGITKRVYEDWVGYEVDEDTMRSLTIDKAAPIYKCNYWDKCKCDELPSGLDLSVFDFSVNSGPSRAIKYLQRIVNTSADGLIGPKTLKAIDEYLSTHDIHDIIVHINTDRLDFMTDLSTFNSFGRGWTKRVTSVLSTSIDMA